MTSLPGEPCWLELFTPDTDAAAAFYGELFGWTATDPDEAFGGYRQFLRDGVPIAGLMANDGTSGSPSTWFVYLTTDDAQATTAKATAAGGQVFTEMQVGDLGHMAMIQDPAGAMVGAWQALQFAGASVRGEVGAPTWFETLSQDYDASLRFYTEVFGWDPHTVSDAADFRYTTLGVDQDARAGIMDASTFLGDQPSRWQFYVQVDDTDATVEKALADGATLGQPVDDSPYGRLAMLRDPSGLLFNLMGPNRG